MGKWILAHRSERVGIRTPNNIRRPKPRTILPPELQVNTSPTIARRISRLLPGEEAVVMDPLKRSAHLVSLQADTSSAAFAARQLACTRTIATKRARGNTGRLTCGRIPKAVHYRTSEENTVSVAPLPLHAYYTHGS